MPALKRGTFLFENMKDNIQCTWLNQVEWAPKCASKFTKERDYFIFFGELCSSVSVVFSQRILKQHRQKWQKATCFSRRLARLHGLTWLPGARSENRCRPATSRCRCSPQCRPTTSGQSSENPGARTRGPRWSEGPRRRRGPTWSCNRAVNVYFKQYAFIAHGGGSIRC